MNLSEKPCYPEGARETEIYNMGLTIRERLIIALASNSEFVQTRTDNPNDFDYYETAIDIIGQADAIIAEMEK